MIGTDRLNDESYMRLALQMATQARGQTGINPVVGCVIVKEGRIVGIGTHLQRGSHHAEIHALHMAGDEAAGSTVYVTLEPCSIHGRTPPCAERLVTERVKRVVVGCIDPNPGVAGAGVEWLRSRGIDVEVGVLEEDARLLNEAFNKFIVTRLPWVTLKTAMTLDGKIGSRTGDSKWISSEASRELVHTMRHRHQAILVGVDTVIADDPQLTTRLTVPGLQPIRLVVDSQLRIPLEAHVVRERDARTIILTTQSASMEQIMRLNAVGVEVMKCGDGDKVDLRQAMAMLGQREIGSVLLEGGGRLNGAMLEAELVDKLVVFVAPKLIGGGATAPSAFAFAGFDKMADALAIERLRVEQIGADCCLTGYPHYMRREAACSPGS
ncbi:bifunctional diaminohydroxyphosphoribosylaminopyrimidine deaminase/5-amino-6-(5-phosphoribosylamino)uracil reductase RibD [Paenibacillus koleovorans]|uniref:bifunctional diaminohydroxyphosphoribosylaminopyrimidine deaminase/5-amino-6-(5-phosphoribosylamino)uracil reductase RibD n=1 Tax=Paenibacillus koleovorans TaxID=121608 RepID=UPI002482B3E5|nr:bifunctional diaminohydroxyphosphoribosylaminopyrimidine deaminase/5-amino-6-(5-phosphoribosylamino)uracil reductase RibD [Paenibacillus koleovorans]